MSDPRRALFLAVVRQAVEDAVSPSTTEEAQREKTSARRWLTKSNAWFAEVCDLLDLDPERARLKFSSFIQATDDNGGIPPRLDLSGVAKEAPAATVDPAVMAKTSALRDPFPPGKRARLRGQRPHRLINYRGKSLSMAGWSAELSVPVSTLRRRFSLGLPIPEVLTSEIQSGTRPKLFVDHKGQTISLRQLSERTGIKLNTLQVRHLKGLTGEALYAPVSTLRRAA